MEEQAQAQLHPGWPPQVGSHVQFEAREGFSLQKAILEFEVCSLGVAYVPSMVGQEKLIRKSFCQRVRSW